MMWTPWCRLQYLARGKMKVSFGVAPYWTIEHEILTKICWLKYVDWTQTESLEYTSTLLMFLALLRDSSPAFCSLCLHLHYHETTLRGMCMACHAIQALPLYWGPTYNMLPEATAVYPFSALSTVPHAKLSNPITVKPLECSAQHIASRPCSQVISCWNQLYHI